MKFLVFLLVAGVAASASGSYLLHEAEPLIKQIEALPVELQRVRSGESLSEALEIPESDFVDVIETKIREEFGQLIRQQLEDLLLTVDNTTADVNEILIGVIKELVHKEPTKENVQDFVDIISSVQIRRTAVGNILDQVFEEKHLDTITLYSIQERGISDWWKKFKAWMSGLGAKISNKLGKFKSWAEKTFKKVIDASKNILGQVKDLAAQFLKENWDKLTIEIVKQGLSFFHPYAGKLGAKLTEMLIKLARDHGLVPWEKLYLLLL